MAKQKFEKKIEALIPSLPFVKGKVVDKGDDYITIQVGKALLEVARGSIAEMKKENDLDVVAIEKDAKVILSSLVEAGRGITLSNVFVELVKGGLVASNCNCNCNCDNYSNCNCNCNCDCDCDCSDCYECSGSLQGRFGASGSIRTPVRFSTRLRR